MTGRGVAVVLTAIPAKVLLTTRYFLRSLSAALANPRVAQLILIVSIPDQMLVQTAANDTYDNSAINQNINEWYSRDSDINPPNQTSLKDTLPLPTTCSPTKYHTSPAVILTRRGVIDFGNEKDEDNKISGGAMAGIVVVSLAVSLGFVICIASSRKRNAQRTQPKPYVLPLHTARRLSTQQRSNTPRRPPAAIVRGGTPPPPPPYTKDDEPAPRYEASWRN